MRGQEGEGDGEVEGRTLFFNVRGCEVDDDARSGKGEAGVIDGRSDPLARLLDGGVGEAHYQKGGKAPGDIDLDQDFVGLDTEHGC